MTHYSGTAVWDAAGSIGIGLLLGFIATFLVGKNRQLLLGRSMNPKEVAVRRAGVWWGVAMVRHIKRTCSNCLTRRERLSLPVCLPSLLLPRMFKAFFLALLLLPPQDVQGLLRRDPVVCYILDTKTEEIGPQIFRFKVIKGGGRAQSP